MPIVLGTFFVSVLMILRSLWKSEELEETRISNPWNVMMPRYLVNTFAACYNRDVPNNRAWPSGKAVDFGSTILGSNPSTRACFSDGVDFVDCRYVKKKKTKVNAIVLI